MERVRKLIHIDVAEELGFTGIGIGVGVLDSGIIPHKDFSRRIGEYADFTEKPTKQPRDETGHGTHVCGIIAGSGKSRNGRYRGVAPGSRLYVGKILNHVGEGNVATLIKGLEWLLSIAPQHHIKIINISVSSLYILKEQEKQRLFFLFQKAWKSDILIVAAAGNSGPGVKTVSMIGDSPFVICVGCHEGCESGRFEKCCQECSGRGPGEYVYRKPDLVAPGTDIVSCVGKDQYMKKSGTSMSTPIVSGALALAFEKYPRMTAYEMKRRLIMSTDDLGENYLMQGFGMINVEKLLRG